MDPVTSVKTAAKVGDLIHSYALAVRRGDRRRIKWIREDLDVLAFQLAQLGTVLQDLQVDAHREVEEAELEQLARLDDIHEAVEAYLETHQPVPETPDAQDEQYIKARDASAEVVAYFMRSAEDGRPDISFLPQFADAMNVRIEFITRLHPHWAADAGFREEIENAVRRLDVYLVEMKELIDKGFVITSDCHPILDPKDEHPIAEVCEAHVEDRGRVVATRTTRIPANEDSTPILEQLRHDAQHDKSKLVRDRQTMAISGFERTRADWRRWLRDAVPGVEEPAAEDKKRSIRQTIRRLVTPGAKA